MCSTVSGLSEQHLLVSDVNVVVCSHGHSDHVGNIGLFPHALLIVGHDICTGDTYLENGLCEVQTIVYYLVCADCGHCVISLRCYMASKRSLL